MVVPIFCTAKLGADPGAQTEKLDKVSLCEAGAQLALRKKFNLGKCRFTIFTIDFN